MRSRSTILFAIFATSLAIFSLPVKAQPDKEPAVALAGSVDLASRFIWRGLETGQSPSIQPAMSVSWKGFSAGAWGAYRLAGAGPQETDLYLSKSIGFVTLSVWDYWCFSDTVAQDYFDYARNTTGHLMEAQLLMSGGKTLPFNLLGSYFFYGADQSESVYIELTYLRDFGATHFEAFAGYQAKGNYYAMKPALVNVGCKGSRSIAITDRFSIPLCLSLIFNPDAGSAYLVGGVSFGW